MKELLFSVTKKDLRVDHFRSGGKGGQHQNKTSSGTRITHLASGAVGESREERSQPQNTRNAFRRMCGTTKFQAWLKTESARTMGQLAVIDGEVERMMRQPIRVEVHDDKGLWIEANPVTLTE